MYSIWQLQTCIGMAQVVYEQMVEAHRHQAICTAQYCIRWVLHRLHRQMSQCLTVNTASRTMTEHEQFGK